MARCARQGKVLGGGASGARNGGAIELRLSGERRAAGMAERRQWRRFDVIKTPQAQRG